MNCLSCFTQSCNNRTNSAKMEPCNSPTSRTTPPRPQEMKREKPDEDINVDTKNIQARNFNFRELATATKNFRRECLLGEGGFGRVYKGTLSGSGQIVAVKQLDRNGTQGNKEFLVEVLMLSLLHHENLVNLIGYCADGDQRLLVHEFMSGGSLEECLLAKGADKKGNLDWYTRMKIASGAARALEYLHDRANPPVIFRDLKSSNILLDEDSNPKLSDFGLAKLGPGGGDKPSPIAPASRVMGTYGYAAPEYARSGELTLKSDVYSFGVVLLELITGRRAIDTTKPNDEQNLVSWAQPLFRDPKKFPDMADPTLNKRFPEKDLNQVVAIASMCLQEEPPARPLISDVVTALSFLSTVPKDEPITPADPSAVAAPPHSSSEVNIVANESEGGNRGESNNGEKSDVIEVEDAADHLAENDGSSDKDQDETKNWHSNSWKARSSNTSSRNLESNRSSKSNGKGSFESDDANIFASSEVPSDECGEVDQGISVSAGHISGEGSRQDRRICSRKSSRQNSSKDSDQVSGSGSSSDSSYSSDSKGSRSTRRSDYGSFQSYERSTSRVESPGNTSLSCKYG